MGKRVEGRREMDLVPRAHWGEVAREGFHLRALAYGPDP